MFFQFQNVTSFSAFSAMSFNLSIADVLTAVAKILFVLSLTEICSFHS